MTKQTSNHAAAAKQIRQHLKANGIKATVHAKSYSGGSSIRVKIFEELPATFDAVKSFAFQFQYGHFDGMDDSYKYSNSRDDIPQVSFVFVDNEFSKETLADAWAYCQKNHADASDHPAPYIHTDYVLRAGVMEGRWGTWLADRKPRAVA